MLLLCVEELSVQFILNQRAKNKLLRVGGPFEAMCNVPPVCATFALRLPIAIYAKNHIEVRALISRVAACTFFFWRVLSSTTSR